MVSGPGNDATPLDGEVARGSGPRSPTTDGDIESLLDEPAADLLRRARAGLPVARSMSLGALEPGQVGVVEAKVRAIGAVRAYQRRSGGEGLVGRVTLADATGECDLVLWDDETRLAQSVFGLDKRVRLRGPLVKAGYRGGVELGLAGCVAEPLPDDPVPVHRIEGRLLALGATRTTGRPPTVRFHADATLEAPGGPVHVVAWDAAVRTLRSVLPGAIVVFEEATAHPELEGWYMASACRIAAPLRNG